MSSTTRLSDYQFHLTGFEGPLDVLLRLIEQQKLAISDVSLVAVTSGFLSYIAELRNPPPQLLADFARVAARLLVIKSRSLLPVHASEETEDDFDDLAARLREYKRARHLAARLKDIESRNWRAYSRSPLAIERPANVRFAVPSLDRLQNMIRKVRERRDVAAGIVAISNIVSTAEMSRRLLSQALRSHVPVNFRSQVDTNSRTEVVAGFIALLSLLHSRRLQASQSEIFGDIFLQPLEATAAEEYGSRG